MEKLLYKFVKENFGKQFTVAPLVESHSIQLLALAEKTTRAWWKRPFGRSEKIVIGNLRDFVKSTKEQDLLDSFLSKAVSITPDLSKTAERNSFKKQGIEFDVLGQVKIQLEHSQILGDLELGKLTGESLGDKNLREILECVELDQSWVEKYDFSNRCLYIITAVVYSEKLQIDGEQKEEFAVKIKFSLPDVLKKCLGVGLTTGVGVEVNESDRLFPMVRRKTRAPLLFKFFKIKYNRETNKLSIANDVLTGVAIRSTQGDWLSDTKSGLESETFRQNLFEEETEDEEKYDIIDFVGVKGDQSCKFQDNHGQSASVKMKELLQVCRMYKKFFPSKTLQNALNLLGKLFDGVNDLFEMNFIAQIVFDIVEKLICSHERKTRVFLLNSKQTIFLQAAGCSIQQCDANREAECVISIDTNNIEPLQEAGLILKEMQSLEEEEWVVMQNILKGCK